MSKQKGNRVERELCKLLNERFSLGSSFGRCVGSGNRWAQHTNMPATAEATYTGDIVCPESFKYTIEAKGGYPPIDISTLLNAGSKQLDAWLTQAQDEADRVGKLPMLVWKADRKGFIAAIRYQYEHFNSMQYNGWYIYSLAELLTLPTFCFAEEP